MGEKPSDSIQPNEKEVYSTKEVIVPGVKVTRGWTSNEHPIISKSKAIDIKKRADLDAEISYENQIDFAKVRTMFRVK